MTHHDRIRHDQSLALRDSLLGSSFSWLTLAVVVLLVATLRSAPVIDIPTVPDWDDGLRVINDYFPMPDAGGAVVPVVPPAVIDARLIPVDDEALEPPVVVPPGEISESSGGAIEGAGPNHGITSGGGEGLAVGPGIPDPGVWVYRDVEPEVVLKVLPLYPDLARQAQLEGRVVVRAFVGTDGRVLRAEVEKGVPVFDRAATDAVERWVFTPALANGHAVAVWVRVPVVFRLD